MAGFVMMMSPRNPGTAPGGGGRDARQHRADVHALTLMLACQRQGQCTEEQGRVKAISASP